MAVGVFRRICTSWHLLVFFLAQVRGQESPIVQTEKGKVRGFTATVNWKKVDVFYSIPYAAPPIGELRYKPTVQNEPWEGVLDGTNLPNSCVQPMDMFLGNFTGSTMWNANTPVSEDCLYLNVWVPRTNPPYKDKAVLVWIYGGGFYSGSSTLDIYNAQYLAAENDIIVVSMQYRVGSLGFLVLDTADAPGNAGLWDQRMALEWVSRNIHHFGGNPHNVTIMGESAGAVSVGLLMLCQLCNNFFQRAILQSGAPQVKWGTMTRDDMIERSMAVASRLGCDRQRDPEYMLACLRAKNSTDAIAYDIFISMGFVQFGFVPIIDGVLILHDPDVLLERGSFKKIPLLLGSNENEATFFLIYYFSQYFKFNNTNTQNPIHAYDYNRAMHDLFEWYPYFHDRNRLNMIAKDAISFHYRNWLNPDDPISLRKSVDRAASDYFFVCGVNRLAKMFARRSIPVYYYWFNQRWSANPWPEWMGVLHADEIWFTFGIALNESHSFTHEERQLSRKMMTYWTNFAKTG